MNLYFRFLITVIKIFFAPRKKILEDTTLTFQVWPLDCDINLHLNNARYLSFMDLGRVFLLGQNGLLSKILKQGWMPVVQGITMTYLRSIEPFQRFKLVTRLMGWDDKYFFIEQRFIVKGQLHATALMRGLFLHKRRKIAPQEIIALIDSSLASPPLPDAIEHWNALLTAKRHYTNSTN